MPDQVLPSHLHLQQHRVGMSKDYSWSWFWQGLLRGSVPKQLIRKVLSFNNSNLPDLHSKRYLCSFPTRWRYSQGSMRTSLCSSQQHPNRPHWRLPWFGGCEFSTKAHNFKISKDYTKGEWDASFEKEEATIWAPDGSVWAKGAVKTFLNQIWIDTDRGTIKGIFTPINTPEVMAITIGFGGFGEPAPDNLDAAMVSNNVFVFMKCLNPAVCKWNKIQQRIFGMLLENLA